MLCWGRVVCVSLSGWLAGISHNSVCRTDEKAGDLHGCSETEQQVVRNTGVSFMGQVLLAKYKAQHGILLDAVVLNQAIFEMNDVC